MWKFTSSSWDGEVVPAMMPRHRLTLPTQIYYPHLCHLHPASLCPCERTVSSAWLQPLCGRAITGWARPPLAGRSVRRLSVVCLCAVCGSSGPCCTLQAARFPVCAYLCVCVCVCVCVGSDFKEETKLLCGDWDKELPLKASWDCCQPTRYSWSAANQTSQH